MAVGLRVRNNNNIIQIDNTYKNLGLLTKGNVTTVRNTNYYGTVSVGTVIVSGNNPQIALIPKETAPAAVYQRVKSGNTFTFTIFSIAPDTIPYYIFDYSVAGTVGPKLKMRDASGNLFFDSSRNYLKIVGMMDVDDGQPSYIEHPTPAGRKCAVLMSVGAQEYVYIPAGSPTPNYYQITEMWTISAAAVNNEASYAASGIMNLRLFLRLEYHPVQPTGISVGTNQAQYPIIDVTHY
ncbi:MULTISPECIES: hypothetical protein [unclassified Shewanella]|uniref:hypothetical protein n=1 Tax=Shewanella TaxID=22 RepID=UPI0021D8A4F7|nr:MULTISPECIES: hypothetical protein [unclassified Shewanella]MCU8044339.1 hypothetical protein [Shewanella sp. SM68]MCU8048421.1 hypothetical protein [Shewanella sp. SM65]